MIIGVENIYQIYLVNVKNSGYMGWLGWNLGFFLCEGKFVIYDLLGFLDVSMWVGFEFYF